MKLFSRTILAAIAHAQGTAPSWNVTTVAGITGTTGNQNGQAATSTFHNLFDSARDSLGSLIFADYGNNVIRKIDKFGIVTTYAGSGSAGNLDGMPSVAQFNGPVGIAIDQYDNVYITDNGNKLIRLITNSTNMVSTVSGIPLVATSASAGSTSTFTNLQGIAINSDGRLLVADKSVLRLVDSKGASTDLAGSSTVGTADGQGTLASFTGILGVAYDSNNNFTYVTDLVGGNYNSTSIRQISANGTVRTIIANLGFVPDLAIGTDSNIYYGDIKTFQINMVTPQGVNYLIAGLPRNPNAAAAALELDGPSSQATFNAPYSVTFDQNSIIVGEYSKVRRVTPFCQIGFGLSSLSCIQCSSGTYSDTGTVCNSCPNGSTSSAGSASCTTILTSSTFTVTPTSTATSSGLQFLYSTATSTAGSTIQTASVQGISSFTYSSSIQTYSPATSFTTTTDYGASLSTSSSMVTNSMSIVTSSDLSLPILSQQTSQSTTSSLLSFTSTTIGASTTPSSATSIVTSTYTSPNLITNGTTQVSTGSTSILIYVNTITTTPTFPTTPATFSSASTATISSTQTTISSTQTTISSTQTTISSTQIVISSSPSSATVLSQSGITTLNSSLSTSATNLYTVMPTVSAVTQSASISANTKTLSSTTGVFSVTSITNVANTSTSTPTLTPYTDTQASAISSIQVPITTILTPFSFAMPTPTNTNVSPPTDSISPLVTTTDGNLFPTIVTSSTKRLQAKLIIYQLLPLCMLLL